MMHQILLIRFGKYSTDPWFSGLKYDASDTMIDKIRFGKSEHAFILVSMDYSVRTSKTKIKNIEITEADYFIPSVTNQKKQKTIMV